MRVSPSIWWQNAPMAWEKEIEVCRRVSRHAGRLALEHAKRGVEREDKSDDSPVTEADRACEQLIVSELGKAFPEDGFLGEEGANDPGWSGRRWIWRRGGPPSAGEVTIAPGPTVQATVARPELIRTEELAEPRYTVLGLAFNLVVILLLTGLTIYLAGGANAEVRAW